MKVYSELYVKTWMLLAGLFIALGLTGVIPAVHYLISNGLAQALEHLPWLLFMAFLYIAGGVIYALRIPERLGPGKFDIWVSGQ